uniref:Cytochrome P450 n=1 Tax=Psilocybe cubensis TaxID=181762 RepID=A0A8H7Y036_PSICU
MLSLLLLGVFYFGIAWATWNFIKSRTYRSVLKNIPGPPAGSWISGSLKQMMNPKAWDFHQSLADTYGGLSRTKGVFGSDELYVYDPKAMHHILVKDQYIYEETDAFIASNKMIFGAGIFTTLGDDHRRQRKMLNPVFSIAHMREMVPIFYDVAHKVRRVFITKTQGGPQEIDVLTWMTRLALELIGQSGLGYTFDELTENAVQHPYGIASKSLVPAQGQEAMLFTTLMPTLSKIGTPAFRRFIVDHLPFKVVKEVRDIIDVLYETAVEIFDSKKKALEAGDEALAAQVGRGKDIISILMKANMAASGEDKLTDKDVLGQIMSLSFAATDTTSSALSRTFHLLALHKDVQDRLREEIRNARKECGGEDIGYDMLVSLPYLDAICRETLRLYPPVSFIMRTARKDIVLPLATPIKGLNGQQISEVPVPAGTNVFVSILASNRNPDLWGPDSYEWKPERWLSPLPEPLITAHMPGIYSHLMTFIGGGRACIGFKFSQLEMKVVLALMVENLEFSLAKQEIIWQMTGIVTPNTDPDSTTPTMPMIISQAK